MKAASDLLRIASELHAARADLAKVIARLDRKEFNEHLAAYGLKMVPIRDRVVEVKRSRR